MAQRNAKDQNSFNINKFDSYLQISHIYAKITEARSKDTQAIG